MKNIEILIQNKIKYMETLKTKSDAWFLANDTLNRLIQIRQTDK